MKLEATLASHRVAEFENVFGKLNKRALKLGLAPLVLTVGEEWTEIKKERGNGGYLVDVVYRWTPVAVEGETPIIEGWELIAHIETEAGINLINKISEKFEVPVAYRESKPFCEHCGTHRVKKYTYVIRNIESGEFMRVGKSCLKDFFDKDVAAYLSWVERWTSLVDELGEDDDGFWGYGGFLPSDAPVRDIIAIAIGQVALFGYAKADSDNPTKYAVSDWFFGKPPMDSRAAAAWRKWHEEVKEAADYEKADEVLKYIEESTDTSEFMHNVKAMVGRGWASARYFGYIVGVIPGYLGWVEREAAKKADAEKFPMVSEWAGNVKERKTWNVRVMGRKVGEGYYGYWELIRFRTEDGLTLAWFNSGRFVEPELGDELSITGTIKKLDEYQGMKQTMLSRVKVN